MSIKNRLDLIVSELGLSGRALEKECGLATGSYSSIGDGVGADKLKKILIRFPQISADWLLTGNGAMFKENEDKNTSTSEISEKFLKILEANAQTLESNARTIESQQQTIAKLEDEINREGALQKPRSLL